MLSHVVWWKTGTGLVKRACFLQTCGRTSEAKECLLEALRISDQDTTQRHAKSDALLAFATFLHKEENNLELAEKIYQELLDAEGEKVELLNGYALLLHTGTNERWEEAENLYERALQLDPRHAPTLSNYAMLQGERTDGQGSFNSSMFLYEEAMANSEKKVKESLVTCEVPAL